MHVNFNSPAHAFIVECIIYALRTNRRVSKACENQYQLVIRRCIQRYARMDFIFAAYKRNNGLGCKQRHKPSSMKRCIRGCVVCGHVIT